MPARLPHTIKIASRNTSPKLRSVQRARKNGKLQWNKLIFFSPK
jgi:hypothetical protein